LIRFKGRRKQDYLKKKKKKKKMATAFSRSVAQVRNVPRSESEKILKIHAVILLILNAREVSLEFLFKSILGREGVRRGK